MKKCLMTNSDGTQSAIHDSGLVEHWGAVTLLLKSLVAGVIGCGWYVLHFISQ